MKQPARSPKEPVINRDMALGIGVVGVVDALAIVGVFYLAMQRYPDQLFAAQTIAFVTLCTSELLRAFAARSEHQSIFSIGVFSNRWMVAAVAASFVLVMAVVYVPFLQPFFDTVPLTADDWLLMLPFFFASPLAMELLKFWFRFRSAKAVRAEISLPDREAAPETAAMPAPAASARLHVKERNAMKRVLIPVDGSDNALAAIRQVIKDFVNDSAMEVHLLNVQSPFPRDIAHFISRRTRVDYHQEQANLALQPATAMLDRFGIPYATHAATGDRAQCIADAARRLRCDLIVIGTARKNSLTRWVENSVTSRVIERSAVPVEVIAGESMSKWERYGIPAAIAAALALAFALEE
jgi:Ca2+-transporting ATPase